MQCRISTVLIKLIPHDIVESNLYNRSIFIFACGIDRICPCDGAGEAANGVVRTLAASAHRNGTLE